MLQSRTRSGSLILPQSGSVLMSMICVTTKVNVEVMIVTVIIAGPLLQPLAMSGSVVLPQLGPWWCL